MPNYKSNNNYLIENILLLIMIIVVYFYALINLTDEIPIKIALTVISVLLVFISFRYLYQNLSTLSINCETISINYKLGNKTEIYVYNEVIAKNILFVQKTHL